MYAQGSEGGAVSGEELIREKERAARPAGRGSGEGGVQAGGDLVGSSRGGHNLHCGGWRRPGAQGMVARSVVNSFPW